MGENIQVAVRVRPFNDRERKGNSNLIVKMEKQKTFLLSENGRAPSKPKEFIFDHSFWSHDGFKTTPSGYNEPREDNYVDQKKLFKKLGEPMLDNAWSGYNCTILAYGQTGSGKSYSIMGHGANKGIVPMMCERLFQTIQAKNSAAYNFQVSFSMLEIYNEKVRDLLSKTKNHVENLKVFEHPKDGFQAEKLNIVPVESFKDIELFMRQGEKQRTIAATKMNETSSRAHTIVSLKFSQSSLKDKLTKMSTINLVDLAGSERAKQTEATGDRFEESKNINKSLLTLGNVIKGLCDRSKGVKSAIPYRDSILTKLLKNALGGNSKTVMIAAISPDAENYDQTLSTLRYADKAKSIKTAAKVNTRETNAMIQELIQEKERLLRELSDAKSTTNKGLSEEERIKLKEEHMNEIAMYKEQKDDIQSFWEKKLEATRKEMEELMRKEQQETEKEKSTPHLSNLNEDPALTGKLIHLLHIGHLSVGNTKDGNVPDVKLNGPRIAKRHATIRNEKGDVFLKPIDGLVLHNGEELTEKRQLKHLDRIRFGSSNLFVFIHPAQAKEDQRKGIKVTEVTYDFALSEISHHAGFSMDDEDILLQQDILQLLQIVQDVNGIAEDMDKQMEFFIQIVSAEAKGQESGTAEVAIRVKDLATNNEFLWNKNKFLNRQSHMQELYEEFDKTGSADVKKENDPFWEPYDTPVSVGVAAAPLSFLSHGLDFKDEPLTLIDYRAQSCGYLTLEIIPCDMNGDEDVDLCVADSIQLVKKPLNFKIKILQAMKLQDRFQKTWCRYKFNRESKYTETPHVEGSNPNYNHKRFIQLSDAQVTHELITYLTTCDLVVEVMGIQRDSKEGLTTINRREDRQKLMSDVEEWKTKAEKLEKKLKKIDKIVKSKTKSDQKIDEISKILG